MRKVYSADLSDKVWMTLKAHLPTSKLPSRLRSHSLREIFDAIFCVLKGGCPWRLLPGGLPPWQTVLYHFRRFRLSGLWFLILEALRTTERKRNGKDSNPFAAIMDSQSVKTTEESANWKGYEAHQINLVMAAAAHIRHASGRKGLTRRATCRTPNRRPTLAALRANPMREESR